MQQPNRGTICLNSPVTPLEASQKYSFHLQTCMARHHMPQTSSSCTGGHEGTHRSGRPSSGQQWQQSLACCFQQTQTNKAACKPRINNIFTMQHRCSTDYLTHEMNMAWHLCLARLCFSLRTKLCPNGTHTSIVCHRTHTADVCHPCVISVTHLSQNTDSSSGLSMQATAKQCWAVQTVSHLRT